MRTVRVHLVQNRYLLIIRFQCLEGSLTFGNFRRGKGRKEHPVPFSETLFSAYRTVYL